MYDITVYKMVFWSYYHLPTLKTDVASTLRTLRLEDPSETPFKMYSMHYANLKLIQTLQHTAEQRLADRKNVWYLMKKKIPKDVIKYTLLPMIDHDFKPLKRRRQVSTEVLHYLQHDALGDEFEDLFW